MTPWVSSLVLARKGKRTHLSLKKAAEFGCRLGAIREVKLYSFPPYQASTVVAVGLTIAAAGFAGRYALQAMKHVEPQVKQVFQNLPKSVRQLFS